MQVRKLDEDIAAPIDRELRWILDRHHDIIEAQVEIATPVHFHSLSNMFIQLPYSFVDDLRDVFEFGVGVRGSDNIGSSGVRCVSQHLETDLERG